MKRLALLALLAATACRRSAPHAGPACPHDPAQSQEIALRVEISSQTAVVRRDLDIAALGRLRQQRELEGGTPQGLTLIENRLSYKPEIKVAEAFSAGRSCAWLESVSVDLTPGQVTIYVPREYAEGSCQDSEILRHEHQHEEINRVVLDEIAQRMREALRSARWLPSRGTPLEVADRLEAERRLDKMVVDVIMPPYDGLRERFEKDQAVIDIPESYQWVTQRCPTWK